MREWTSGAPPGGDVGERLLREEAAVAVSCEQRLFILAAVNRLLREEAAVAVRWPSRPTGRGVPWIGSGAASRVVVCVAVRHCGRGFGYRCKELALPPTRSCVVAEAAVSAQRMRVNFAYTSGLVGQQRGRRSGGGEGPRASVCRHRMRLNFVTKACLIQST